MRMIIESGQDDRSSALSLGSRSNVARSFYFFSSFRMDARKLRRRARRIVRLAYAPPARTGDRDDKPFRHPGRLFDVILVALFALLGVANLL